ncbi:MAG: GNAT family N-acetyltransferase [Coriobacteriia bacterium]
MSELELKVPPRTSGGCKLSRVVRGVDPSEAVRVAELFHMSFGEKLAGLVLPADREAGIALLAKSLRLGEVYAALDVREQVIGVAIVTGRAPVIRADLEALIEAFGSLGGSWRYAAYRIVCAWPSAYPKKIRGLEGFSVAPECRGKGIGSVMLGRIVRDARAEGARAIELNVGDKNPARHLYERAGFAQLRTIRVGPFAARLGFKRFVFYELSLQPKRDARLAQHR